MTRGARLVRVRAPLDPIAPRLYSPPSMCLSICRYQMAPQSLPWPTVLCCTNALETWSFIQSLHTQPVLATHASLSPFTVGAVDAESVEYIHCQLCVVNTVACDHSSLSISSTYFRPPFTCRHSQRLTHTCSRPTSTFQFHQSFSGRAPWILR